MTNLRTSLKSNIPDIGVERNFMVNLFAGLIAYTYLPHKPSRLFRTQRLTYSTPCPFLIPSNSRYQGVQSFDMEAGDELAFILVQHTTIQDIYQHPYSTSQWGKKVLFSTDTNQVAAVDNNGTLAFEDIVISSGNADYDYNDFIFQVRGLESNNTVSIDEVINPNRDWRNTRSGQDLLDYADRSVFDQVI